MRSLTLGYEIHVLFVCCTKVSKIACICSSAACIDVLDCFSHIVSVVTMSTHACTSVKTICVLNLQVAFGPVARELVLYRYRAPECSFYGELPADWTPPDAATFCRSYTAYYTSLLANAAAVKLLLGFV